MRVESQVTSVSWIPSEAVTGPMKASFVAGVSHYDRPPPSRLGNLSEMRDDDAFRFANELIAWAEFEDSTPTKFGQRGGQVLGSTTIRIGPLDATFAAVPMPELRPDPVVTDGQITFTQTVGGRTALPMPRHTSKPPFLRLQPPLVWTTLRLTLHADGSATPELAGASPFPRHWVYDESGAVAFKAGVADWRRWLGQESWTATPWGEQDSPVVVAAAESELERGLSTVLMRGARKPRIRKLKDGEVLTEQGAPGDSLFLLLDGILDVTHNGRSLGPLGPGAIVGERAVLEDASRTATLTALTNVTVAEASADTIDRAALTRLAESHRRELTLDAESE